MDTARQHHNGVLIRSPQTAWRFKMKNTSEYLKNWSKFFTRQAISQQSPGATDEEEGKLSLCIAWRYMWMGEVQVQLYRLTSALHAGLFVSGPGHFTPLDKSPPCPLNSRLGPLQIRSGTLEKKSLLPVYRESKHDSLVIQSLAYSLRRLRYPGSKRVNSVSNSWMRFWSVLIVFRSSLLSTQTHVYRSDSIACPTSVARYTNTEVGVLRKLRQKWVLRFSRRRIF